MSTSLIWEPLPGGQADAFHSTAWEALYGAGAGIGKTSLLCGKALTIPGSSLLFRREKAQLDNLRYYFQDFLDGNLFRQFIQENDLPAPQYDRFRDEWLLATSPNNPDAKKVVRFASADDIVSLPEIWRTTPDKNGFALIGFDELVEFKKSQYLQVVNWIIATQRNLSTKILSVSNSPFDHKGQWVLERWGNWIDPDRISNWDSGTILWFAYHEKGEKIVFIGSDFSEEQQKMSTFHHGVSTLPFSRVYVNGDRSDNKFLSDEYVKNIHALPEPLRTLLLKGEWIRHKRKSPLTVSLYKDQREKLEKFAKDDDRSLAVKIGELIEQEDNRRQARVSVSDVKMLLRHIVDTIKEMDISDAEQESALKNIHQFLKGRGVEVRDDGGEN